MSAIYLAAADVLNETVGHPVLPVGERHKLPPLEPTVEHPHEREILGY
jgi:hypothetical protein